MNDQLLSRARAVIPGGVNSPARAFKSVGGNPLFASHAQGPYLYTTDGRKLIDTCLSFGPMILGHADEEVQEAVKQAVERGTSYAVTTEAEIEMAELLSEAIPMLQKVRLVNSGTEAVMTALRLARGATGRSKILKFSGCYHGHIDSMLVQAGSGVAGIASASSAGVTEEQANDTLVAPYNNLDAVKALFAEHASDIAAIVVEPLAANMGLVMPTPGFLRELRHLCDDAGALLIFDEVITGFRLEFGAYANMCCATPDLVTLGKIIGGGLPIGAIGGRVDLMDHLAPDGDVYQAGTLSGNPLCVAAGLATLRKLQRLDPYKDISDNVEDLCGRIEDSAEDAGIDIAIPRDGTMFSVFFRDEAPQNFNEVMESDSERFVRVFHRLVDAGIYLPPSPFETSFLSVMHDDALLDQMAEAWDAALKAE